MLHRREVIHVGDLVRVIDPRRILSIGYERDIGTCTKEAEQDPRVRDFCSALHLSARHARRVYRAVGASILDRSIRDGAEKRIVFAEPDERLQAGGHYFNVLSKHTRYTGRYESASGGGSDCYGEYDYQPACLSHAVAHVILELGGLSSSSLPSVFDALDDRCRYHFGWYLTTHQVEKVPAA